MVQLKEKQFIAIGSGVRHRLEVGDGCRNIILNVEFSCTDRKVGTHLSDLADRDQAFARLMKTQAAYLLLDDNGQMEYALKDLIQELERKEKNDYMRDLLFQRMLMEWARCVKDNKNAAGVFYLKKAQEYIRKHLVEDIRVTDVAQYVGLNHSYLETLFARTYGCGIMEHINNQRIEKAQFLLRNSNMAIIDIAFEVGFNSRQHFGYTFKKRCNISPKQYRKLKGLNVDVDTGEGQKRLEET